MFGQLQFKNNHNKEVNLINSMLIRLLPIVLCSILYPSQFSFARQDTNTNYGIKIGVIPQQSARKITKTWMPVADYLQRATGYPFRIIASPDIATFEKRLFSGQFDLVYMNPKLYVDAAKQVGYKAIAREADKKLVGVIVVHKDSTYKNLSDLEGKSLVFPADAFAASVITRLNLAKHNIKYEHIYVSTHDMGYALVSNKEYDAAGGVLRTYNKVTKPVKNQLRILWESEGTTPHAFAVHPRVDTKVASRIQQVLLDYHLTPEGQEELKSLGFNKLVKANDKDWDDVRKLMNNP